MKKQLSPKNWKKVYNACLNTDRIYLLSAINAALEQTGRMPINSNAAALLSQHALAKIAFEIAKQTALIEQNNSRVRIDPEGTYTISFRSRFHLHIQSIISYLSKILCDK
ncbi:hypothetical protein [Chitinophaga cymbidii]|uniref:Uncharacterized protein n=1 Tax=Chitinophaga cymbidii TaxID=1096750 RepID=A0A512RFI4_9BACT|nr:hypothetical protein [Chitinophaga cymbidii]GEP94476.1 hypothetical protein CCY01nite_07360 [Chitinophaga cymbidii]